MGDSLKFITFDIFWIVGSLFLYLGWPIFWYKWYYLFMVLFKVEFLDLVKEIVILSFLLLFLFKDISFKLRSLFFFKELLRLISKQDYWHNLGTCWFDLVIQISTYIICVLIFLNFGIFKRRDSINPSFHSDLRILTRIANINYTIRDATLPWSSLEFVILTSK